MMRKDSTAYDLDSRRGTVENVDAMFAKVLE
jgi:hypothetical protein